MNKTLLIDYYTDILCVWAWIAQHRIDELYNQYGGQIELRHHCIDLFGDVPQRIEKQWGQRGSYNGFAKNVQKTAESFDDVPINSKIWTKVRPETSANAHLLLKAVEIATDRSKSKEIALTFRNAFFVDAQDIGNLDVLFDLIKSQGLDYKAIIANVNNGKAMAALMGDYQKSKQKNIAGSPSFVIDNGRQTLYGNVGYRVIRANIEELLRSKESGASWC